MNREIRIAKDLLSIRAVFFRPEDPFTWASGIQSPVYCDNRLTLTAPDVRNDVEYGLMELVEEYYPEAEVLMGTSTAGIAHAAITAWNPVRKSLSLKISSPRAVPCWKSWMFSAKPVRRCSAWQVSSPTE